MALDFKQQQVLTKEGTEYLLLGNSYSSWEEELASRGLYPFDIDRLSFEIDKEIGAEITDRMLPEIEETGEVINHYGLANDVFERVVQQQRSHFRKLRDARVRLLARNEYSIEEILAEVEHPFYNMDDVHHVLTKENKRKEFNNSQAGIAEAKGSKAGLIGGLALAAGVLLTATMSGQGYYTVFLGLIAFGLYMIGKSFFEED